MDSRPKTQRIALLGGPGSGKSTAAADLFVQLKKLGKNVELVPEWIRRDIMRNGLMTNPFEQYRTLQNHRQEEDDFPSSVEYLICDGNTLLPYVYTAVYSSNSDPRERLVITDMYESMLTDLYSRKYDKIYVLESRQVNEIGVDLNDGTRFQSEFDYSLIERTIMLIFTELHRMDNVKVVNCPLHNRTEFLIHGILGVDGVEVWNALRRKEMIHEKYVW